LKHSCQLLVKKRTRAFSLVMVATPRTTTPLPVGNVASVVVSCRSITLCVCAEISSAPSAQQGSLTQRVMRFRHCPARVLSAPRLFLWMRLASLLLEEA
jgi:hypothetical protein